MILENIYTHLSYFYSHFLPYIHSNKTDLSNPLLSIFDGLWLSFADKLITGIYNFMSLIVTKILLGLASVLSTRPVDKTEYFAHLSFNSTLQLIMAFQVISKSCLDTLIARQLLIFLEFHLQLLCFLLI